MRPLLFSDPIWFLLFVCAFLAWTLPELVGTFAQRSAADSVPCDRGSYRLIVGVVGGAFLIGLLASFFATGLMIGVQSELFMLAIGLMLFGVALRLWSYRCLGSFFTRDVAIARGHRLVDSGIYRWIRHPSYTGASLTFAGAAIIFDNWIAWILIPLASVLAFAYRVHVEEQALISKLGRDYLDYMRRTRRFIPFIW